MATEDLPTLWHRLLEGERRTLLAALQAIADEQAKAGSSAGMESLSRAPVVDIFAARPVDGGIIVHFFYHYRFWCRTLSGSDWDEHHFHSGEADCREGKVVSHRLAKEILNISEYDCNSYDEAAESARRREAVVAAVRSRG